MDDEESEDRQPPPLDGSDTDTPMNMDVGRPQPVHEDQADQRLYGSLHSDEQRHNNGGQPDIANATTMCSVLTDNGRALDTPLSSGGSMNNVVMPLVTITNAPAPAQREIRIEHIRLTVGSSSLQSVRRTHSVIVTDARPSSLPSMRDSNRVVLSAAQNMATRGYRRPIFDMLNQETFHGIAPMQSLQPSSAECLYNESPPCSMPQQEELGAVGGACCMGEMHIGGATNWKWIEESLSASISPVSRLLPSCQSGNHHIATNDPEMDERSEVGGACCTDDKLNNENLNLRLQLEEARRREDEARKLAEEQRQRAEEERQRAEEERQRAEEERQRAEEGRQTNEELRRELEELRLLMRMSLER